MRCITLTKPRGGIGNRWNISSFTSFISLQHRSNAPIDHYKSGGMWSRVIVASGVEQVWNAPPSGTSIDDNQGRSFLDSAGVR
jgi:hypothetical protein